MRALIALAVIVAAGLAWRIWISPVPRLDSLAVLPFADLSSGHDQDWFCAGMTDAVIQALGEVGVSRVISRTSMQRYRDSKESIAAIARELGVDAVVEASVLLAGDRVRVNARLLRGDNEQQLWGESFDRPQSDVLDLYADIAAHVAERISVTLGPGQRERLASRRQVNPAAYQAYLRGQFAVTGLADFDQAREHFERAVALDTGCAEAWAGLASLHIQSMHGGADPKTAVPAARAALRQAFMIDPDLQPAWVALAHLAWEHEWNGKEAAKAFGRALVLNPSDSSTQAFYAYYCLTNRRFEASAEAADLACRLDPWNLFAWTVAHYPIFLGKGPLASLAVMDQAEERFPTLSKDADWIAKRAHYLYEAGSIEDALGLLRAIPPAERVAPCWINLIHILTEEGRSAEAESELDAFLTAADESDFERIHLARACAMVGRRDRAMAYLEEIGEPPVGQLVDVALVHLLLADRDGCFEILETAYAKGCIWLSRINCNPQWYDRLHDDPRFQDLVARMGLES